jgi:hypothetical protein
MVLTVSFVISPVIVAGGIASANLTPASRRQDHTNSPSAVDALVRSIACVHRIPPRVRDDREPPLRWDETVANMEVIWVGGEGKYFLGRDWTGGISLIRLNKSAFGENALWFVWTRADHGRPFG